MILQDLSGKVFLNNTVLYRCTHNARYIYYMCQCTCGYIRPVLAGNIKRKGGCPNCVKLKSEFSKSLAYTKISWLAMRARCRHIYPDINVTYINIKVCDRWKDFHCFVHDMGKRPMGYSLDRIDYLGNYTPDNCRWATNIEQSNNRRSNKIILINGEELTLANAVRKYAVVHYDIVQERIWKLKWTVEAAFFTPKINRVQNFKGKRDKYGNTNN